MNPKRLFILSPALSLLITMNLFAETQKSFVRKIVSSGIAIQSIQTRDMRRIKRILAAEMELMD